MSFWENATQEQKLAQIDGGIECGMNATQIAINCGTTTEGLRKFGRYHDRSFGGVSSAVNWGERSKVYKAERNKVEATKRHAARNGTLGDAAFSIFGDEPQEEILSWAGAAQ